MKHSRIIKDIAILGTYLALAVGGWGYLSLQSRHITKTENITTNTWTYALLTNKHLSLQERVKTFEDKLGWLEKIEAKQGKTDISQISGVYASVDINSPRTIEEERETFIEAIKPYFE